MRLRLVAVVVLCALGTSCGIGPAEQLRRIVGTVERAQERSHDFSYVDDSLDGKMHIVVEGRVADDFRYAGSVFLNGKKLYDMVISDDAVALHLIDIGATKKIIDYARATDKVTADALSEGRWVVDFAGAPALRVIAAAKGDTSSASGTGQAAGSNLRDTNPIGDDPFFDAADALHYTQRAMVFGMAEFNPDDIEYNPVDDPWKDDAKLSLRSKGVHRFDLRQPGLPGRAQRGQRQQLPTAASFRKMAVYIRGPQAYEIREQISIRDRREFRRAEEGRTAQYYIQLRDSALQGRVATPMRERKMTLTLSPFSGSQIVIPPDAVHGILKDVLGPSGLKTLFKFHIIGANGGNPVRTGTGGALPVTSPAASSSP